MLRVSFKIPAPLCLLLFFFFTGGQIWAGGLCGVVASFSDDEYLIESVTNGTNPADVHKVIDPDDKHFFFSGKVINGGLVLAAHLVDPDGKRSKNIRGRDAYDMMLKHFEGKFTVISDVWAQNPEFGDNIDLFNRLVSEGVRPEVAATKTWSGQQAIRNGYKLKSLTTRGLPGEYIWVMARWEPK